VTSPAAIRALAVTSVRIIQVICVSVHVVSASGFDG
jgi:hypothetical protein